jgi:hypothetical protein
MKYSKTFVDAEDVKIATKMVLEDILSNDVKTAKEIASELGNDVSSHTVGHLLKPLIKEKKVTKHDMGDKKTGYTLFMFKPKPVEPCKSTERHLIVWKEGSDWKGHVELTRAKAIKMANRISENNPGTAVLYGKGLERIFTAPAETKSTKI